MQMAAVSVQMLHMAMVDWQIKLLNMATKTKMQHNTPLTFLLLPLKKPHLYQALGSSLYTKH